VLHLLIALQTAVQVPPPPRGYGTSTAEIIVDAAQVIPPSSVDRINRIAFDVHQKSRGEIAVVTLPDIGLRAPVDVALGIGRAWGVGASTAIGQQTRNAGVVILLVPKESSSTGRGECFITTGQGTEGFITDADAASLCREAVPLFQQQEYGPALEFLTARVAGEFAREFGFTLDSASAPRPVPRPDVQRSRGRSTGGLSPFAIFVLFIVAYMILSSFGRRRGCSGCIPIPIVLPTGGGYHRGGWGGGGFGGGGGGGFGGFGGGGGFSGGGGGSSW
jgi:uncharacterized protein